MYLPYISLYLEQQLLPDRHELDSTNNPNPNPDPNPNPNPEP